MSAGQRLHDLVQFRKYTALCWHCALRSSRGASTLPKLRKAKDDFTNSDETIKTPVRRSRHTRQVSWTRRRHLVRVQDYEYPRVFHGRSKPPIRWSVEDPDLISGNKALLRTNKNEVDSSDTRWRSRPVLDTIDGTTIVHPRGGIDGLLSIYKPENARLHHSRTLYPLTALLHLNRRKSVIYEYKSGRFYATAAASHSHKVDPEDYARIGTDTKQQKQLGGSNIRDHLKLWQQQQAFEAGTAERLKNVSPSLSNRSTPNQNTYTQSGEDDSSLILDNEIELDEEEPQGDVEWNAEGPDNDVLEESKFLQRGDLVELSANNQPIFAIFVRNLAWQSQFYTMRGEWAQRTAIRVRFSVPHFVQASELDDILPYLPAMELPQEYLNRLQAFDASAPREVGAKLIEKMSMFHQAVDNIFRKNSDRLNRAYEIVAPPKAQAGRTIMTLGQIAVAVLQKNDPSELSPAMMYAVHKALLQSDKVKLDGAGSRQDVSYQLYPQQNAAEVAQVRQWVREFQEDIIESNTESFGTDAVYNDASKSDNPFPSFIKKARAAIERSRLTRQITPTGCLGPSSVKIKPVHAGMNTYRTNGFQYLNANEKMIIQYMDAWARSRTLHPNGNISAAGPMILRAIGAYAEYDLDQSTAYTFLQELGIISPWENHLVHSTIDLRLPDDDGAPEWVTQLQEDAVKESNEINFSNDSMKDLRKDWGDMPVFCIDSLDTVERDDGISVQPVENVDDEYWVHIHVADPSAFIKPESATARCAGHFAHTMYFPERKHPMLSSSLTSQYLSLANGRPCLTFSGRISREGEILEKRIVPGIINNVHTTTPHEVGCALGVVETNSIGTTSVAIVGGDVPVAATEEKRKTTQPLADSHVELLRTLYEISHRLRSKRTRNGALIVSQQGRTTTTFAKVFLGTDVSPTYLRKSRTTVYEGDPIVSVNQTTTGDGLVDNYVMDIMVLAGEICASWCSERNIPIPYRGLIRNPEPAFSLEAYKRDVIDPAIEKDGSVSVPDRNMLMRQYGRAGCSSSPMEHILLGVPVYCQATSPLRRYADMYTHWQVEAALRYEAATGASLVGSTDQSYLPFSRAAVEEYAKTIIQREVKIKRIQRAANKHWIIQALFRAFYFKEAPLPETMKATVQELTNPAGRKYALLHDWQQVGTISDSQVVSDNGGLELGDVLEVKLQSVDTYWGDIHLEPVRILERGNGSTMPQFNK